MGEKLVGQRGGEGEGGQNKWTSSAPLVTGVPGSLSGLSYSWELGRVKKIKQHTNSYMSVQFLKQNTKLVFYGDLPFCLH